MMVTVMLLSSFVALFLLMAASTRELNPIRALLSATLCGLYAGACMIPAFSFFGGSLWRLFFLMLIGSIAFGIRREGIRQSLLFVFFQLTVSGILSAANKPFAAVFASRYGITENRYLKDCVKEEDRSKKTAIYNMLNAVDACRDAQTTISYEQARSSAASRSSCT